MWKHVRRRGAAWLSELRESLKERVVLFGGSHGDAGPSAQRFVPEYSHPNTAFAKSSTFYGVHSNEMKVGFRGKRSPGSKRREHSRPLRDNHRDMRLEERGMMAKEMRGDDLRRQVEIERLAHLLQLIQKRGAGVEVADAKRGESNFRKGAHDGDLGILVRP